MDRSVLKQKERYQLSYDLPHEAFRSHVYPRKSSNGSTVIIYGHEQGLRVVWYAGKAFKPKKQDPPPKVNGTSKKDAMVIDLDDDDEPSPAAATTAAPAEFASQEGEVDPLAPYRDVLRSVDIPLGTTALRTATPHITPDLSQAPPHTWPEIYHDHMITVAACSDLSIRLVSIPLDPPAPDVHDVAKMDVQVIKLEATNFHQQFISDIAITHTAELQDAQLGPDAQSRSQSRPQSQSKSNAEDASPVQWSLLIATISGTGAGLLLIHQVPLQGKRLSPSSDSSVPIRRAFLRSSSMGAKLSFNTSPYPAERHSTLLLTLPSNSNVKVYQPFQTHTHRERRGSNMTTDSVSPTRSTRHYGTDRGKFLITLLPSFHQTPEGQERRKRVLDAHWIAGGRAIIALLEDGEWGIWDLEAVGPTTATSGANLIRGEGNISGIQGGSCNSFAVRSNVGILTETKQRSAQAPSQPASGSLAPMTPSTRKMRSEGLFQGTKNSTCSVVTTSQRFGSIAIRAKPTDSKNQDESAIIAFGDEMIYLSSIWSFWKSETKPLRLPTLRLGGQAPRSICLLPSSGASKWTSATGGIFNSTSSKPDFLLQTAHRLVLSIHPLPSRPGSADASTETDLGIRQPKLVKLVSGDLDIDDMDRILDGMGGPSADTKAVSLFSKGVGFDIDEEDVDVDMTASPTPSRLRVTNGQRRNGSPPKRRVFS